VLATPEGLAESKGRSDMSNLADPGLQGLIWVKPQPDPSQEHIEISYAIDTKYVYRREIDQSQAVPRPRYFRAAQSEVLSDALAWDEGRPWESCDEMGEPLHPTWHVRVTFETVAVVAAPDAESAKVKAISRLGLPAAALRYVHATARPMPLSVK
jgi:hypothetical protein